MNISVQPHHVWKNKPVYLKATLPNDKSFGNKYPIQEGAKGEVISNGFESGRLKVLFNLYAGKETVQFNELSANNYLVSDFHLQRPIWSN